MTAAVESVEIDLVELDARKEMALSQARQFQVTDAESYAKAAQIILEIKAAKAFCEKPIEEAIKAAHQSHQRSLKLRDLFVKPFEASDQYMRKVMLAWSTEQERKAKELAAKERQRIEAEQAAQRQAESDKAAALAADLKASAAIAADPVEADMLAYEATQAQQESQAIAAAPLPAIEVRPVAVTPHVAGFSQTVSWSFEVVDLMALLKAVVEGKAPITFVMADTAAIGREVRKNKEKFSYPGIKTSSSAGLKVGGR